MRQLLFRFAGLLLVAYLAFFAGGLFALFSAWPMDSLAAVHRYLFGNRWHDLTPLQTLKSDLGFAPYKNLATVPYEIAEPAAFAELEIPGSAGRRDNPLVFVDEAARDPALTLVAGFLDTAEGLHGALLLSPAGELVHRWVFEPEPDDGGPPPTSPHRKTLHGLAVLPDASMIVAFHEGTALGRYDACGRVMWRRPIAAHHSVTLDGPGHAWTIADYATLTRVDVETGEIVDEIRVDALAATAPGKWILTSRKRFHAGTGSRFSEDPFHVNDVEALPPEIAGAFPMFRAGDLLVSHRSGNLVYVLRPETREILWWMSDGKFAQHDPDWQPDGTIVLFDNNTDFGPSRVIRVDPATGTHEVVVDGAAAGFYTDLQGNQQMRADGGVLLTSSRQGRAVEFDAAGRKTFEFVNLRDRAANERGLVTEARILPLSFAAALPDCGRDPGR